MDFTPLATDHHGHGHVRRAVNIGQAQHAQRPLKVLLSGAFRYFAKFRQRQCTGLCHQTTTDHGSNDTAIGRQQMQTATFTPVHILVQAQKIAQIHVQHQIALGHTLGIGDTQQQGYLPSLLLRAGRKSTRQNQHALPPSTRTLLLRQCVIPPA